MIYLFLGMRGGRRQRRRCDVCARGGKLFGERCGHTALTIDHIEANATPPIATLQPEIRNQTRPDQWLSAAHLHRYDLEWVYNVQVGVVFGSDF